MVVDVEHTPLDFVYRYCGTAHVERKKIDRTGARLSEGHPEHRWKIILYEYEQVVTRRSPLAFRRGLDFADGRPAIEQVSLRLPLSSDGETIDKIVVVTEWDDLPEIAEPLNHSAALVPC